MKKRVLSGMRPTGPLHLGHLLGALDNWKKLQENHDCFFMVADWHSLMSEYANPSVIRECSVDNVIDWLSYGIDPKKSTVFRQSDIKEHLELMMIFSNLTPLSWLERCPTYKEQLREVKGRDLTNYGFLGYPVLQAADISLYKARAVPVGEDQLPHLEFTREICRKFNGLYKKEVFPMPEALLTKEPRLLGLDNRKMSKSYDNFIALSDSQDTISKKVASMFTDPTKIRKGDPGDPVKHKCNVYTYHRFFGESLDGSPKVSQDIERPCKSGVLGCVECKKLLAETLINFLKEKVQKNRRKITKEKVNEILSIGANKAREVASNTMKEVRKLVGLA